MTKEEIIEMAKQARLVERIDECHRAIRPKWIEDHDITTYVEAFAKMIAEKEREECAKICDEMGNTEANMNKTWRNGCNDSAKEIRARGQE